MDIGLVSRVGLQLLLEPQSTAFVFRGACVAAGAVYPAYATYKTIVEPSRAFQGRQQQQPSSSSSAASVHSLAGERWLKYWTIFGATVLAERLLEHHLDRVPYYPHAKLLFFLWLQSSHGHGACLLFDAYLTPWLCRYESKVDTLLEVGAQLAAGLYSTYAGPIGYLRASLSLGLAQLSAFVRWITTPDDPPGGRSGGGGGRLEQQQQQQQQYSSGGGGGGGAAGAQRWGQNLVR